MTNAGAMKLIAVIDDYDALAALQLAENEFKDRLVDSEMEIIHSLAHSPIHSLTHSLIDPLTHSPLHSFTP